MFLAEPKYHLADDADDDADDDDDDEDEDDDDDDDDGDDHHHHHNDDVGVDVYLNRIFAAALWKESFTGAFRKKDIQSCEIGRASCRERV